MNIPTYSQLVASRTNDRVSTFTFHLSDSSDFAVRAMLRDDGPWFVAADVCAALTIGNSRDALDRLDADEKGVGSIDTLGGLQQLATVNESGLYSLILGSRKPEAKPFKRWVTGEVLPAIRKTGGYSAQPVKPAVQLPDFTDPAEAAIAWAAEYRGKREAEAALALAAPKVEMVDKYMDATGSQTFRQVAKLLQAKEPAFRAFLAARRILYQIGGTWTPYAEHLDAGRFVVKTGSADNGHAFSAARFTPKGVAWVTGLWSEAIGRSA